jgi:DNA adenine methylase
LKSSLILCGSFENIVEINKVNPKDFLYFDPPYPPLNQTSNFNHYTLEKFNFKDQLKVSELANELDSRGCKVLISNADTPDIRDLYWKWRVVTLPVKRWVSANGIRRSVNELVIYNYEIREEKNNDME